MIGEEAAAAPGPVAPEPVDRSLFDTMMAIASGNRFMSQVPTNIESLIMEEIGYAQKFFNVQGWNNKRDIQGAYLPAKEIWTGITQDLSGLVVPEKHEEAWAENERFLAGVENLPRQKQIGRLRHLVFHWVSKTGIGLPPRIKEAKWDVRPEDVFVAAKERLAAAARAREILQQAATR